MTRYAAFLRAINVGGHIVKMERLRQVVAATGVENVETFIASGNVVFQASRRTPSALEALFERELQTALNYRVATFIRSMPELAAIAGRRPFGGAAGTLYVGLLKAAPGAAAVRSIQALTTETDRLDVMEREIYWLVGTSFSQSTVTGAALEKAIAGESTFRNVSTLRRMAAKWAPS